MQEKMNFETSKKRAAMLSILSNSALIGLKLFAGIASGSIGILSEALHSGTDLLASFVAFFSVSESSKPADRDHQFGHGKYEDFAGLIEGALIIFAAFYIIYESLKKFFSHIRPEMDVNLGLWVMLISVLANIFVSSHLFRVAKDTDSAALFADAEHLRTDVFSSAAVFLGLLMVKLTGKTFFDPLIAIVIAIIIFLAGWKICMQARNNLLDMALSANENSQILGIVGEYLDKGVVRLSQVRTRKAGGRKNIELVLLVNGEMKIREAHDLCDRIEEEIENNLKNTDVSIHLEPAE